MNVVRVSHNLLGRGKAYQQQKTGVTPVLYTSEDAESVEEESSSAEQEQVPLDDTLASSSPTPAALDAIPEEDPVPPTRRHTSPPSAHFENERDEGAAIPPRGPARRHTSALPTTRADSTSDPATEPGTEQLIDPESDLSLPADAAEQAEFVDYKDHVKEAEADPSWGGDNSWGDWGAGDWGRAGGHRSWSDEKQAGPPRLVGRDWLYSGPRYAVPRSSAVGEWNFFAARGATLEVDLSFFSPRVDPDLANTNVADMSFASPIASKTDKWGQREIQVSPVKSGRLRPMPLSNEDRAALGRNRRTRTAFQGYMKADTVKQLRDHEEVTDSRPPGGTPEEVINREGRHFSPPGRGGQGQNSYAAAYERKNRINKDGPPVRTNLRRMIGGGTTGAAPGGRRGSPKSKSPKSKLKAGAKKVMMMNRFKLKNKAKQGGAGGRSPGPKRSKSTGGAESSIPDSSAGGVYSDSIPTQDVPANERDDDDDENPFVEYYSPKDNNVIYLSKADGETAFLGTADAESTDRRRAGVKKRQRELAKRGQSPDDDIPEKIRSEGRTLRLVEADVPRDLVFSRGLEVAKALVFSRGLEVAMSW